MRKILMAAVVVTLSLPALAADEKTQLEVITECSQAVQDQLKYPDSFDMHAFSANIEEPGTTLYDGWYLEFPFSSQNEFGAEVVMIARCREVKGIFSEPSKMVVRIEDR